MTFQDTHLWRDALAERQGDDASQARDRLRSQLLGMRQRVRQLISHIPADCKDLTVHDLTHLDALWDSAQQVCGEEWSLNPAEAFVFGAAVLIHDAALTALAYPEGRSGLKKTTLWADLAASRKTGSDTPKDLGLSPEQEESVLFEVLRTLHAEQAKILCLQDWSTFGSGPQYLIEDSELRTAYGESIGRIAASHHWNAEALQDELMTQFGGSPTLPNWPVNEVKLACLLRCADAAQVDRTRAPLMMFAAIKPRGYSELHWRAQSKLNRPVLKRDAIHFNSSSMFNDDEAEAWWVVYDLATILDKELRSSNAILTDIGERTFAAQRVAGAETPATFSKYVKTNKWRPIDASIKVTDPLSLARTLGGRNLYGPSQLVPFREVVQNSADAIRFRRALQSRGQDFGKIKITVEQHPTEAGLCTVHIDDDGVGMSERVLTSTLVDFGKSFWTSDLMQKEFPGQRAAGIRHIGKFGIGFFSVFELSQDVRVTSRRYDAALDDVRILDFRGLATRPLLREGRGSDLPQDISTRISINLPVGTVESVGLETDADYRKDYTFLGRRGRYFEPLTSLRESLLRLVSFLDIRVEFTDNRNGSEFVHLPDIYDNASEILIEELGLEDAHKITKHYNAPKSMRLLVGEDGITYGRASLDIDAILDRNKISRAFFSVGGIVTQPRGAVVSLATGAAIPFFGIIEGKPERASRDFVSPIVPEAVLKTWLREQLDIIDHSVLRKSEFMSIGSFAFSATDEHSDLPFAFYKGEMISTRELSNLAIGHRKFFLPMNWRYDSWLQIVGYDGVQPEFLEVPLTDEVIILAEGSDRIVDEEGARNIKKEGGGPVECEEVTKRSRHVRNLVRLLENSWGKPVAMHVTTGQLFSTSIASLSGSRWVLSLEPSRDGALHNDDLLS